MRIGTGGEIIKGTGGEVVDASSEVDTSRPGIAKEVISELVIWLEVGRVPPT